MTTPRPIMPLFDRARDPMLLLDPSGVCVEANAAACDLLGAGESIVGRSFAPLLLDASDGPFSTRLPTTSQDLMVDVEASVTLDAMPQRHLVILRRKRSPSLPQAMLWALFEGAPSGVLLVQVHGQEHRCAGMNRAMSRLGLVRKASENFPIEETCIAGVAEAVRDAYEECLITREPHNAEHIFHVGGRETWWLVSTTPVFDDAGTLVQLVCSFLYVDFLKRTEEQLRDTEATFRELIDRIPDAVVVSARQGVLHANRAALELLGVETSAIVGSCAMKWIHPADRASVRAGWSTQRGKIVGARVMRGDGTSRIAEIVAMPVVLEGRSCVLAIVRDVTERNELQAKLAQADRTIALATLAGGVAHEINTPLSYVCTNVAYVCEQLRTLDVPVDLSRALEDALTGTDRVARIVRELRALARGDRRSITAVDLKTTLEGVVQLARADIEARAKLVMRIEDVGLVRGNQLLGQVFLNLLVNASQAIPHGDPKKHEIEVRVSIEDGWACVRVSDSGPGIATQHLQRIFDPFFTTKAPGQGMGLGLPLAQRIIEACGGTITATSPTSGGAVFEVRLVRVVKGPDEEPDTDPHPPPA